MNEFWVASIVDLRAAVDAVGECFLKAALMIMRAALSLRW
ncbi:hypothetical protein T190_29835 [Sinorhizobium meliloti CCBAU 01290]|nr:hypothetical protein T190_29835 [Sinorhizobium meliloti CCBAU 01290]